jgi:fumarate hydratase subunit beta
MEKIKKIKTPLSNEIIEDLKAGDNVTITGYIYTGRDAAHKRLINLMGKLFIMLDQLRHHPDINVAPQVLLPAIVWIPILLHYWI